MRRGWVEQLAVPGGDGSLELDPTRFAGDEIVEGFLVARATLETFPVVAGIAIVPPDLRAYLRAHGNVLARIPLHDTRVVRFVWGHEGSGFDKVPFDEVVAHYGDLAQDPPEGAKVAAHPEDAALTAALEQTLGSEATGGSGRGLVLGCGVGRGAFTLRAHVATTLGVEWSLSRVRRARNLAATQEPFLVPLPGSSGKRRDERPLDLDALTRDAVDFVAGAAEALPLRDASIDVVVVGAGDARGAWADPALVDREARRVLRPGGVLLQRAAGASASWRVEGP